MPEGVHARADTHCVGVTATQTSVPRTRRWRLRCARIDIALLHGFAAGPFTWRDTALRLRDGGHRVMALDRPWVALEEQVHATLTALDAAGMNRAVLVGHSAGAEVAVAAAAQAPERVRALILLGPVLGRGAPPIARALARTPGTDRVAPAMLRAACRAFLPRALGSVMRSAGPLDPSVVEGYRQPLLEPGVTESLWAMTRADPPGDELLAAARNLLHPCLVVVGDHDRWTTPVPVPGARAVTLERCGHLPHEEQPERTAEEILRFLDDLA